MTKTLLSFLLSAGFCAAHAQESECAQGYEKAAEKFSRQIEKLESLQQSAEGGVWLGAAAGAGCAVFSKTPAGVIFCAVVGSSISGSAYAAGSGFEATLQRLSDADRILKAYTGDDNELMRDVGADLQKENQVTESLAQLMEDGTLCAGGRYPVLSYDEVVGMLKQRLAAR